MDIYVFNLINSKVRVLFNTIDDITVPDTNIIEWENNITHDSFLREHNGRLFDIGEDIYKNGTYWGLPVTNDYFIAGATHRIPSMKLYREKNKSVKNVKFLTYNTSYWDLYKDFFNMDFLDRVVNSDKLLTCYFIIPKDFINNPENHRLSKESVDKVSCKIVSEINEELYLVKSFEYRQDFIDRIPGIIKNEINELNKTKRVKPNEMIRCESYYVENKHVYDVDKFYLTKDLV